MANVFGTIAVGIAVLLFVVALVAMSNSDFAVAGFCFLSASVVIYLRETRLV